MGLIGLVEHYTTPPRRRGQQASSRGHKRLVHFMLRCEIISQAAAQARIVTWEAGAGPTVPADPVTRAPKGDTHGYAHYRQQELRLLVPARLAALQNGRPRIRRTTGQQRRSLDPGRAPSPVTVVSRALPHP